MDYFTAQNEVVTYTSADGYASYEIGRTREQYMNGEVSQAELIDLNNPDEEVDAVVNTGRDDVMLNLRRIPSSEGAVLGMLPNGAHTRPLLDMGEWMLVDCNGTRGYLMTQYIARPEEESAVSTVTRDNATLTARVKPLHGRHKAQVFDADSDDAEVLGHLKPNVKVDFIGSTENGWCHIVFEGHDGHMRDEDLLFTEAGKT